MSRISETHTMEVEVEDLNLDAVFDIEGEEYCSEASFFGRELCVTAELQKLALGGLNLTRSQVEAWVGETLLALLEEQARTNYYEEAA